MFAADKSERVQMVLGSMSKQVLRFASPHRASSKLDVTLTAVSGFGTFYFTKTLYFFFLKVSLSASLSTLKFSSSFCDNVVN